MHLSFLPCIKYLHFSRGQNWKEGVGGVFLAVYALLTYILKKGFKERTSPNKNLFVKAIARNAPKAYPFFVLHDFSSLIMSA
jgi:hypothetical protein